MVSTTLQHLLTRARRRLLVALLVRTLGKALFVLLLVILPASLVQRWTGAALLIPATAAVVMVLGLYAARTFRFPAVAAVALELDRQFALDELLSTALLCTDSTEPFAQAVVLRAQQVARDLDLRWLNAGSHALISWLGALLLCGLLPIVYGLPSMAATPFALASRNNTPQDQRTSAPTRLGRRPGGSAVLPPQPRSALSPSAAVFGSRETEPDMARARRTGQRAAVSHTSGNSAGAGLAQSSSTPVPTPVPSPVSAAMSVPAQAGEQGGATIRTGTGRASGSPEEGFVQGIASAVANSPRSAAPAPLGETASPGGFADPEATQIPDEYHDLLKAYFAR